MENTTQNPALYRELAVPFSSKSAAQTAITEFLDGVEQLRKKHRIPDLYWIVQVNCHADDGAEQSAILHGSMGNSDNAEPMLAYALGVEQTNRKAWIAKLMAGGRK